MSENKCHCTGAEAVDCTNVCPFAGGFDAEEGDYLSDDDD